MAGQTVRWIECRIEGEEMVPIGVHKEDAPDLKAVR